MEEQKATKVTLYLPPDLHRQLKIRSAVEGEAMSAIAKRAIDFYLANSDVVDGLEAAFGHTYEVHSCPSCSTSLVMRDGELAEVSTSSNPDHPLPPVESAGVIAQPGQLDEGELVVC
ncbi:MAG: hypothetical protein EA342_06560 [Leptolyngbya sp. LCM1.Bin17]|nr:MAG: hypothetical protein EA342_06560 [Leptolyngbya sp. LCM1.Bin17]